MIGRRCTHGNMFSRPVLIARTLSFTGKIKQETRFELICLGVFLSAKYCGGYSGGEPPLPIPNREVKPAIADGTAPPGGRVGSCRSSKTRSSHDGRVFFIMPVFLRFFSHSHTCNCQNRKNSWKRIFIYRKCRFLNKIRHEVV